MLRGLTITGLCALLGACSTLPRFNSAIGPSRGPTVSTVISHIGCELKSAADANVSANVPHYVVYADLTLEVTNDQGVNPTLNFINPYSAADANFTAIASGKFTGEQHRTFNQTFTLELDPAKYAGTDCGKKEAFAGLEGDLGIQEIFKEGVAHQKGSFPFPDASTDPSGAGTTIPVFGTTIDFTVVYGLGGGPNWTLKHFTGPSSDGLIDLSRTKKDTLVLSFAQMEKPSKGPFFNLTPRAASAAAAAAAKDNATRMILQQLINR